LAKKNLPELERKNRTKDPLLSSQNFEISEKAEKSRFNFGKACSSFCSLIGITMVSQNVDQGGRCHSERSEESHQIKKLQILHSVQDDKNGTFYEIIKHEFHSSSNFHAKE
jgi:hypothetical protein